MRTQVVKASNVGDYEGAVAQAARALMEGALIVFPTETVYGIAANAAHRGAMTRLRELKGRPDLQPFTVHIGRPADARDYVSDPSPLLRRFIRKAWPGPLTIVAATDPARTALAKGPAGSALHEVFHENTVGLRCPDQAVATQLLSRAGVPVVASSANAAGDPPARDAAEALRHAEGRVEYVLDAGPARYGSASTVVKVEGPRWSVLRTGRIDERTLRRMERTETLFVCTGNSCRSPMAERLFLHKLAGRLNRTVEQLEADGYGACSAGVSAYHGSPATAGAIDALGRRGIDLGDHRSQPVTVELLLAAERVYTMTPEHRRAILDLAPGVAHKVELLDSEQAIADPIGGSPDVYEHCAEQIERAIDRRLEAFSDEDRDWQ